ncbi:17202_t:CDS:2 [Cetraspora pellucida]|uniref:17202_t:CDS:1 n=1 Tax=Cetraspora pellucida TaxID=1433469 RepID=A0A9N9F3X6_9GLOM|nr:17202_t:CDS:2 [Cetraspora pellucida]
MLLDLQTINFGKNYISRHSPYSRQLSSNIKIKTIASKDALRRIDQL